MTAEQILCKWAEGVALVKLEEGFDPGYSELTPGEGAYVGIFLYDTNGKLIRSDSESDHVELIKEVARFGAELITSMAEQSLRDRGVV